MRFYPNGGPESVYLDRPPADAEPLYRSPTITAEEREAIAYFAAFSRSRHAPQATGATEMNRGFWLPKATTPPPPAPPAPPLPPSLRLTAEEREAIAFFTGFHTEGYGAIEAHAATLRKLLARFA